MQCSCSAHPKQSYLRLHPSFGGLHRWPFVWNGIPGDFDLFEQGEAYRSRTGVARIILIHDITPGRFYLSLGLSCRRSGGIPSARRPTGRTSVWRAMKEPRGSFWRRKFVNLRFLGLDSAYLNK
ncbi:hypothetical protein M427DRAFT_180745 [Gonapodya prolifera JEL478]|uniref:Uncharacterized protein n=1 Tax=Gonapodya prolifera (strain JEL478) TaxID=1344416 RepID=A0A139AQI7_GONPJ|nr:hypothetical protein M427DRAFT_180745 [Gonapodya prolifera JEL478]|eukprot:KXS18982.1 hypothetical protein M427DRAFT_180745 [Gonapodya prolifera JEL478]